MTAVVPDEGRPSIDDLVGRMFNSLIATADLFTVYLGDKLGYYRALADVESMTSTELANATNTNERYAREWLEQQSATGILTCGNPEAQSGDRRFRLPEQYRSAFTDSEDPYAIPPFAQIFVGSITPLQKLVEAFRTGDGVPYADYGLDLHEGQARFTRPMFTHQLAKEWIPVMSDIDARLKADPPARVADIGMGQGWSSINIARSYPNVFVDGFDLDHESVVAANQNAATAGVADRVTFHEKNAGDDDLAGKYDFALAFECVHDMSDPVAVLGAMRRLVGEGGTVLIVDENAAESFHPDSSEVERALYGFSVLHCLPVGMADKPSVETGTVMRPSTFEQYANSAGFASVEVLPIENDFYRFYRLTG